MRNIITVLFVTAMLYFSSCDDTNSRDQTKFFDPGSNASNMTRAMLIKEIKKAKVGFFSVLVRDEDLKTSVPFEKTECHRLFELFEHADLRISLDHNQEINWRTAGSEKWSKLEHVVDKVKGRTLLKVSRGKALVEGEAGRTDRIIELATQKNFYAIVITDAHSSGVIISRIVLNGD